MLTWTTELPYKDGWYFSRTLINGSWYTRVTYVFADSRGRMWSGSVPGSRGSRVRADGTEWAGPIQEPGDADRT